MIFITGHLGFIGKNFTKRLDDIGIEWEGYDLKDGQDILDYATLVGSVPENSIVIHLAALTGVRDGEKDSAKYLETNVVGAQNVIEACKEKNVQHLVFFSSSSVLGNRQPPNKETDSTEPVSVYGISKLAGEKLVEHSGLSAAIVRPFTVYGENGRENQVLAKWNNVAKKGKPIPFYGDGSTKRGYTYVGDLFDGVMKIIEKKAKGIFHLGGAEVTSLQELLGIFREMYPQLNVDYLELPSCDVHTNYADISKAREHLHYRGDTNFRKKVIEICSE